MKPFGDRQAAAPFGPDNPVRSARLLAVLPSRQQGGGAIVPGPFVASAAPSARPSSGNVLAGAAL